MKKFETFKSFEDVVAFSTAYYGESQEFDCNISLTIDGSTHTAHTVSICNCDILFYCDSLTANYLVDTVGSKTSANLFCVSVD